MAASTYTADVSTPSSLIDPYIGGALAVASGVAALLTLWVRTGRARAQVSGDDVKVQENKSQVAWIKELEHKLVAESQLRIAAESRERVAREQHLLDMLEIGEQKAQVAELRKKVSQLERRMAMISELLIIERPDLAQVANLLKTSEFVPPDFLKGRP